MIGGTTLAFGDADQVPVAGALRVATVRPGVAKSGEVDVSAAEGWHGFGAGSS